MSYFHPLLVGKIGVSFDREIVHSSVVDSSEEKRRSKNGKKYENKARQRKKKMNSLRVRFDITKRVKTEKNRIPGDSKFCPPSSEEPPTPF